ncbi:MAG: hypothetical protein LC658_02920, partial [Bacteroidales bacterium]|nr:hypothetical protein [Bacteroidales bacterium]
FTKKILPMKVKLKDSIISELTCLGLRPGMVVSSTHVNKITGAVDFTHYYNSGTYNCVVWPEDYEIVEDEKVTAIPGTADCVNQISKDIPNEIQLPIIELTNALDAMYWVFSPFLDNSDLSESPWIENLIKSYNSIVSILPHPWNLQYEQIEY